MEAGRCKGLWFQSFFAIEKGHGSKTVSFRFSTYQGFGLKVWTLPSSIREWTFFENCDSRRLWITRKYWSFLRLFMMTIVYGIHIYPQTVRSETRPFLPLEWLYCVGYDKFIKLWSAIALKCAFNLSHANWVRYACNKLHFIALILHFIFFVGIHICHWGGRI